MGLGKTCRDTAGVKDLGRERWKCVSEAAVGGVKPSQGFVVRKPGYNELGNEWETSGNAILLFTRLA